jgi:simple sugar transport system substrate-binding protein
MRTKLFYFVTLLAVMAMVLSACATPTPAPVVTEAPTEAPTEVATEAPTAAPEPFVIGMLLVGPANDHGWSQATFEGAQTAEQKLGAKLIYLENVYSGSPAYPGTTTSQLAEQLVDQGAKLIIFNSDDMKDEATKFAQAHTDVPVIMISGDQVWKDGKAYTQMDNMVNIMGRMEYGKMMAGCAAALTTKTGQIGFLGPLINDETRRLAASAYLGAKYCWTKAGKDPAALKFKVTWIGFWFNIPGVTSDPTQVADDFFNSGYDVVISGIDTTEALTEAKKMKDAGKEVWAIPYDFKGACDQAPDICLGVPYFNWGPALTAQIQTAIDGTWTSNFQWNGPDWADINNAETSAVGFADGPALSADGKTGLDAFIAELAGGLNLWTGPINLQDGTVYLADGVVGTDQEVWYLPQLLEGMEGQSVPQ